MTDRDTAWAVYLAKLRANHISPSEAETAECDFKAGYDAAKGTT